MNLLWITFTPQGDVVSTILLAQRNQMRLKDKQKDKLRKIKKH